MAAPTEQILLRVYLQSADRTPYEPTFGRVLREARRRGLAGATILRGIVGFGRRGWVRPSSWSPVRREPVIVEMVDQPQKIGAFVQEALGKIMTGGMATLERAAVMMYRQRTESGQAIMTPAAELQPLSTLPHVAQEDGMTINESAVLLRIFIGESDRWKGRPLYEAIVHEARERGFSGATVLRGSEGFGANSIVHKASLLEMSTDLPIVIEMVESREKIDQLLPLLQDMVTEGMVTMEYVTVLIYRGESPSA